MVLRAAIALLGFMLLLPSAAMAEKRVALVIGNGAYTKVAKLDNPKNDAAAMEAMFKATGFDTVVRVNDLGVAAMRRALRDFSDTAYDADIAVVFYAGHGMEVSGTNYLIPTDAVLERDIDVQDEAISLDRVNQILERVKHLRLVILDACRDNPFVRSMRRTLATRTVRSGYGEIDEKSLPPNTLVAYAQRAGAFAEDGTGANSPYTTALLKHLPTPGLDVELALRRVRDDVLKITKNRQEPFKYGSLGGAEISLVAAKPQPQLAPEPKTLARLSEAGEAWGAVKDTASIAALEAYIARFKDTFYAELARQRIDELKKQQVAVAVPPKTHAPSPAPALCPDGREVQVIGNERRCGAPAAAPKVASPKGKVQEASQSPAICPDGREVQIIGNERRCQSSPARCDGVEALVGNERRCLKPKDSFKDCPECPEMVVIPMGEFMMGSTEYDTERPVHKVTIPKPFAVGKFEVTFAEWDACVSTGGCKNRPDDQGWGRDNRPVINVSWGDTTNDYLPWLTRKTGKLYRLPTEAEWEYAARAGSRAKYTWGDFIARGLANCDGCGSQWDNKLTAPIGSFSPNAFGLHDMHGNVWEWVADCHRADYYAAPSTGAAATEVAGCSRVIRGGSWNFNPVSLRAAVRHGNSSGYRHNYLGFRVARTLTP